MGQEFAEIHPSFDTGRFVRRCMADHFDKLELKGRIDRVAVVLSDFLPGEYSRVVDILIRVAPHVNEFENWILTAYVEQFGKDHLDESIRALEQLTQHGTGEFAIRHFVINHTEHMLKVMQVWAQNSNEHLRRLAAEGSRPRGVWTAHIEAFKKNPRPVLKILEKLKNDPSLYVRKAVANNLNDISRDNPEIVIKTVQRWKKSASARTEWILKRGCRTLIKQGHPEIMPMFGFTPLPRLKVDGFAVKSARLKIGTRLRIPFKLISKSRSDQRLAIDYKVGYLTKRGGRTSKIFKFKELNLSVGQTLKLEIKHRFADGSTRKHYPGEHTVELLINGRPSGSVTIGLRS